ncbi:MAG: translation initiation factor IF-2 [Christensenellaceae bacterium]|jgi:translation initiation factor IF-2|nr:translation initiation factor IF-2 [Christensenellaceae bacterium]
MAETENRKTEMQVSNITRVRSFFESKTHLKILNTIESEKKRISEGLRHFGDLRAKFRAERKAAAEALRIERELQATLLREESKNVEVVSPIEETPSVKEPVVEVETIVPHVTEEVKEVVEPASEPPVTVPSVVKVEEVPVIKEERDVPPPEQVVHAPVEEKKPEVQVKHTEPRRETNKGKMKQPQQAFVPEHTNKAQQHEATKAPTTTHDAKDSTGVKPRESRQQRATSKTDSYETQKEKMLAALNASIFEKPKKTVIEKPVIRIYVPPVEEPKHSHHNANNASGTNSSAHRNNQANSQQNRNFNQQSGQLSNNRTASQQLRQNSVAKAATAPAATSQQGQKPVKRKADANKGAFDTKRTLDKKTLAKKGYVAGSVAVEYDEVSGEIKKVRSRKIADKKRNAFMQPITNIIQHAIITKDKLTIKELSEKIGKTGAEIIRQLFFLNIIKTINDAIDFDTADLVSSELGIKLELQRAETEEERTIAYHDDESDDPALGTLRPPVVTIMGHVDHGKTSILDFIRKANVASGEAGGITQHIGAYSVLINGSKITFLDTPGHAAFTAMRARGANVTDIVVIVVAADDGIMPQTVEAINHAKAASVSMIVALNKIDKSGVDIDKIYSQLSDHGLLPEAWGGSIPVIKMSAKTGEGINALLENILTLAEVADYKANPDRKARGTIIEARLDKGKGPVATVLVQNGTLRISDYVVAGVVTGKIRAMHDSAGRPVTSAEPSSAVSILGLQNVPEAGDQLLVVESEKMMRKIAEGRTSREQEKRVNATKGLSLDDVFKGMTDGKLKNLNLIIKADVQGSVEAIKDTLVKLSNDEIKVSVVHAVAGAINESDVMLADTTGSIIIGFNVRPDSNARSLADRNSIDIRLYRIIYDAIDDVKMAVKGLSAPKYHEQYLGKAEVRETFKITGTGVIAGCMVKDGKITRNAKVRLIRDNIVVADTQISSLKRMKDDVREVAAGFECGVGLDGFDDIKIGDIVESFNVVQNTED